MPHLVLLGDSIFDNAAYTSGGPDVVSQVRKLLPRGWRATLLAVDGSTTAGVAEQVQRLPSDETHLILERRRKRRAERSLGARHPRVIDCASGRLPLRYCGGL